MEIGIDELVLTESKVIDALEEVVDGFAGVESMDVWAIPSDGKWFLVSGYSQLVKGIIKGEDYFDVTVVGEFFPDSEEKDVYDQYAEEYEEEEEEEAYRPPSKPGQEGYPPLPFPSPDDRWAPIGEMRYKGLEKLTTVNLGEIDV